ncbi:hypothetical protein AADZ84_13170 [Colwelliaceae bacterium MEBiC 14330]
MKVFKKIIICSALFSQSVFAVGVWTIPFEISALDEYGHGLRVSGVNFPDPAKCEGNTQSAFPNRSSTTEMQNRYNGILLAAFMSNHKVQLKISDKKCTESRVIYYAVRVVK